MLMLLKNKRGKPLLFFLLLAKILDSYFCSQLPSHGISQCLTHCGSHGGSRTFSWAHPTPCQRTEAKNLPHGGLRVIRSTHTLKQKCFAPTKTDVVMSEDRYESFIMKKYVVIKTP